MPTLRAIGFVEPVSGRQGEAAAERHPEAIAAIAAWAASKGYDAAIWSALTGNFGDWATAASRSRSPRRCNMFEGLERDNPPKFAAALAYIRNTPAEIETPVRERAPDAGAKRPDNRAAKVRAFSLVEKLILPGPRFCA